MSDGSIEANAPSLQEEFGKEGDISAEQLGNTIYTVGDYSYQRVGDEIVERDRKGKVLVRVPYSPEMISHIQGVQSSIAQRAQRARRAKLAK